jgi:TorA maturation chaperone TorD
MEPTQQAAIRANVYKLLSECFKYPENELNQVLHFLAKGTEKIQNQELTEVSKDLLEEYVSNSNQEYSKGLQIAYSSLFVGPFELLASPYSSVYLDAERRVMGDATRNVINHYISAGLSFDLENTDLPDHISTELEFMYYLSFQFLNTSNMKYKIQHVSFLNTHL